MRSTVEDNQKERSILNRLPPSTVRLLSSGQVITSVSTVVKELIENALDADATNIEIKLENEGLNKIEVKDNGKGVRQQDVPYMCRRMYTSKIRDFCDLENLNTYGFRGEALNSLCAVSQVSVTTKTDEDDIAICYYFDNEGNITSTQSSHLNKGTIVTVVDLFKNLPVRRQYLSKGKRKAQELKFVDDIVKSFGLINPRLRIVLSHNKFFIWQKSSVSSFKESLVQVIPFTVAKYLHEISYSEDNLNLLIMIPMKDCHVWNTCYGLSVNSTNIFINSRPIKNKQIEKAVQEEVHQFFGSTIPKNKTPFCVISITISPSQVDVNLEPNKTKVIIKDMENVVKILKSQTILYYFGALEPPKSYNEEEMKENNVKRKNTERTPSKKTKKLSEEDNKIISPKKQKLEDQVENNMVTTIIIPESDAKQTLNNDDEEISEKNFPEIEITETDENIATEFNCEIDPFLNKLDDEIVTMKKSEQSKKDISVSIQDLEKETISDKKNHLVGIMSDDESSSDSSLTEEICKKVYETHKITMNEENEDVENTVSKEKQASSSTNDKKAKTDVNLDQITLSQWSRGDVKVNGQTVDSSTKLGTKVELLKKKLECLPRINNTNDLSSQEELDRSISSQMGCKEMSAFTKFAREIRTKIIDEAPGISFTTVAAELACKWKNLHDSEKKTYENMAKDEKEKSKPTNSIFSKKIKLNDPSYKPKLNSYRYNPPETKKLQKKYCKVKKINVTMDMIKNAMEKRINYKQPTIKIITTFEENLLLINDQGKVISASLERLKETIALHHNLAQMKIPLRLLDKRVAILQSELQPEILWNILDSFETSFDDTFKSIIVIIDERIVKNGFRIEKIPASPLNQYFITDVPTFIKSNGLKEIKEILQFINLNTSVKLKDCRPVEIFNFIKDETLREEALTKIFSSTDFTNALDTYKYWSTNLKSATNCPHFRPVNKILFPLINL